MKKLLISIIFICLSISLFAQNGKMDWAPIYGQKAAVFGGSFSCIKESEAAKQVWRDKLNLDVTTYGVGGMGFSILTGKDSIPSQVNKALEKEKYDIYILWASTNDFGKNCEIGTYRDWTKYDNFDDKKLETQCGGINYCIQEILKANPEARIYFFTTLSNDFWKERSNDPFYKGEDKSIYDYVKAQMECCKYWGVPCFNMYEATPINYVTSSIYVQKDGLHLTEACYKKMGETMAMFMASH